MRIRRKESTGLGGRETGLKVNKKGKQDGIAS